MKIVFVGANDWANEANRITRAINRAGTALSARCVTSYPHPFVYEEDLVMTRPGNRDIAKEVIREADWLITTGDGDYDTVRYWFSKNPTARKACMHVGAAYRDNPGHYDSEDATLGMERRFFCPDLLRFALEDPRTRTYVIPPDGILMEPVPLSTPLEVLHTPSSPERKATVLVDEAVRDLPGIRYTKVTGRPFPESWAARAGKHIFIDHLSPEYGAFGGAMAESACYGMVLIADIRHVGSWVEDFHPRPPIIHVEGAADCRRLLETLVAEPSTVAAYQAHSLRWAHEHLSPKGITDYWTRALS